MDMRSALFCYQRHSFLLVLFISIVGGIFACSSAATALESVLVPPNADAIDLTTTIEVTSSRGDQIQLSSAPGADGFVRRFEVSSITEKRNPEWVVFSLTNSSDRTLQRIIVFRHEGSTNFLFRLLWPKTAKTVRLTSDRDTKPKRLSNLQKEELADADVFRISLKPFSTATFIAEIQGTIRKGNTKVLLWNPDYFNDPDIWEAVLEQPANRRTSPPYIQAFASNEGTALITFELVRSSGDTALADTRFILRTRKGSIIGDFFGAYPSVRLLAGEYEIQAYREDHVSSRVFTVRPQEDRDVKVVLRPPDSNN